MKNTWLKTSISAGIVTGIITFILTSNWKIALIITSAVIFLVVVNNPKKRYMRVAWMVISMVFLLNRFAFQFVGQIFDIAFEIKGNMISDAVSIILLILAALALILDYLERNNKLDGTFFSINKNSVKNTSGTNNHINQHINQHIKQGSKDND
ncbi:MAG: hypothetical protein JKY19_07305 [Alcanivoracaceae bacterium]|nr:hypothetical protein [Alcanivoracaceae bacterium]